MFQLYEIMRKNIWMRLQRKANEDTIKGEEWEKKKNQWYRITKMPDISLGW